MHKREGDYRDQQLYPEGTPRSVFFVVRALGKKVKRCPYLRRDNENPDHKPSKATHGLVNPHRYPSSHEAKEDTECDTEAEEYGPQFPSFHGISPKRVKGQS